MHTISNTVERKFVNSIDLSNLEIETDGGWQPVSTIHKTVPYTVWKIETASGLSLECADTHILFNEHFDEIFTKDIVENHTRIITQNGVDLITKVFKKNHKENMFDVTVAHPDHRFYTNDILSHNTTIINALSYALYGQALTNIKRDNLINKTNSKNMLVTVNFEKEGISYFIERGRRPNLLKYFVANQEQEQTEEQQGDSRETQKNINHMLGMGPEMFKHLVALNTYTQPFLSLNANDQRNIIEQLLGITLLSEKAEKLKDQNKQTKDMITEEDYHIKAVQDANGRIEDQITNLRRRQHLWKVKRKEDSEKLQAEISELSHVDINQELKLHADLAKWTTKNNKQQQLQKDITQIEAQITRAEHDATRTQTALIAAHDGTCSQCGQGINHLKSHKEHLKQAEKTNNESNNFLKGLQAKAKKLEAKQETLPACPETVYSNVDEAHGHKSTVAMLGSQLQHKLDESDPYADQISEMESATVEKINYNTVNKLARIRDHQEFLLKLLTNKDSFIRKRIIEQNLNFLNKRLTHYLDKMGLPHTVRFMNDLTVEIQELGRDLDFDNLSRGERNRLILSLSWTFRDVWESLYQPINVLFVDELIDSGLDSSGVENALAILKHMARDRKKSVWLVSHKDELSGRVGNVLNVIKENGFTSYSTDVEVA